MNDESEIIELQKGCNARSDAFTSLVICMTPRWLSSFVANCAGILTLKTDQKTVDCSARGCEEVREILRHFSILTNGAD